MIANLGEVKQLPKMVSLLSITCSHRNCSTTWKTYAKETQLDHFIMEYTLQYFPGQCSRKYKTGQLSAPVGYLQRLELMTIISSM